MTVECFFPDEKEEVCISAKLLLISNIIIPDKLKGPPTSLQLVRAVKVNQFPTAVCHYKDYTYVGLDGGEICRIDSQGQVQSSFIKVAATSNIRAYGDQLYCLQKSSPNKLHKYGLSGHLNTSWVISNASCTSLGNKLSGVTDTKNVVAVAQPNQQIVFIDSSGTVIRKLACSDIPTSGDLSSCYHMGKIFISSPSTSKVFCVDEATGTIEWTADKMPSSVGGLACYEGSFILLARASPQVTITVVDFETGEGHQFVPQLNIKLEKYQHFCYKWLGSLCKLFGYIPEDL